MYKYCLLVGFIFSVPALATIDIGGCADGQGDLLTTRDNIQYCKSKMAVNWWSAIAWCKSLGKELITLDDCLEKTSSGLKVQCPHLYQIGSTATVWTQNVPTSSNYIACQVKKGKSSHFLNFLI